MKKINVVFVGAFFLILSMGANAQTKNSADYFVGKWNILTKSTPSGDRKNIVSFEMKEGKLVGAMQDTTGVELYPFTSIDIQENSVTVIFPSQGMDVPLNMKRKDDDHITGDVMGMFEVEGVRVKEKTK